MIRVSNHPGLPMFRHFTSQSSVTYHDPTPMKHDTMDIGPSHVRCAGNTTRPNKSPQQGWPRWLPPGLSENLPPCWVKWHVISVVEVRFGFEAVYVFHIVSLFLGLGSLRWYKWHGQSSTHLWLQWRKIFFGDSYDSNDRSQFRNCVIHQEGFGVLSS